MMCALSARRCSCSGRTFDGPQPKRPSAGLRSAGAVIERHGPLTPSELAACERIQRPTATRVLARLEEAGWIDRASDPADRRSSLVSITPEGRELLRRLRTRKDAFLARRLDGL